MKRLEMGGAGLAAMLVAGVTAVAVAQGPIPGGGTQSALSGADCQDGRFASLVVHSQRRPVSSRRQLLRRWG